MNITITTFTSAVGLASLRILFIQLKGFTEIVCDLALSVENKALHIFFIKLKLKRNFDVVSWKSSLEFLNSLAYMHPRVQIMY